jgi:hypothetical protein
MLEWCSRLRRVLNPSVILPGSLRPVYLPSRSTNRPLLTPATTKSRRKTTPQRLPLRLRQCPPPPVPTQLPLPTPRKLPLRPVESVFVRLSVVNWCIPSRPRGHRSPAQSPGNIRKIPSPRPSRDHHPQSITRSRPRRLSRGRTSRTWQQMPQILPVRKGRVPAAVAVRVLRRSRGRRSRDEFTITPLLVLQISCIFFLNIFLA